MTDTAIADADSEIVQRVEHLPWDAMAADLDARGYATTGPLLSASECDYLSALFDQPERFRSRIVMARHGFGSGEYQYFAHPLPPLVAALREAAYPPLAAIANRWRGALGEPADYPETLGDYLARCHEAGQQRPTPLLLKYGAGDYNRLHQDLYGEHVFPLQLAVLLSTPGEDFTGGEFLLVEQRPRTQSRGMVVPLRRGDAVIFPVSRRPATGRRGFLRLTMRHGVSELHTGQRFCLGVIFHDAA